jgi:cytochrome c oxidase cbb3-type subunit III
MRWTMTAMCLSLVCITAVAVAQRGGGARGGAQVPAVPGAQANRGQGRPAPQSFPAQQRTIDTTLAARGNTLYGTNCRTCHGADLRGGERGGTNLLRSALVLNDQAGELIFPVVRDGLNNRGMSPMPPMSIPQDDVKAIAEYIHSIAATAQRQGGPPPGPPITLDILVGDAAAGKAYFASKCSGCHSDTGDLKSIGARFANPRDLQNSWIAGGGGGRGANQTPVTATVTLQNGQKVEGRLNRIDDFIVILNMADGSTQSFRRNGDVPKVDIRDPRAAHRNLLPEYTDKDIHNLTAYLVTLK